jgi:hypothetical protein
LEQHEQSKELGFAGFLAAGAGIGITLSPRMHCGDQVGMELFTRRLYI